MTKKGVRKKEMGMKEKEGQILLEKEKTGGKKRMQEKN